MLPPLLSRLTDSSCKLEKSRMTHMVHFNNTAHQMAAANKQQLTTFKFLCSKHSSQNLIPPILLFFYFNNFSLPILQHSEKGLSQPPYHTKNGSCLFSKARKHSVCQQYYYQKLSFDQTCSSHFDFL